MNNNHNISFISSLYNNQYDESIKCIKCIYTLDSIPIQQRNCSPRQNHDNYNKVSHLDVI